MWAKQEKYSHYKVILQKSAIACVWLARASLCWMTSRCVAAKVELFCWMILRFFAAFFIQSLNWWNSDVQNRCMKKHRSLIHFNETTMRHLAKIAGLPEKKSSIWLHFWRNAASSSKALLLANQMCWIKMWTTHFYCLPGDGKRIVAMTFQTFRVVKSCLIAV